MADLGCVWLFGRRSKSRGRGLSIRPIGCKCLASHLMNICLLLVPVFPGNDGVLIRGNPGMRTAGNPGKREPGNENTSHGPLHPRFIGYVGQ